MEIIYYSILAGALFILGAILYNAFLPQIVKYRNKVKEQQIESTKRAQAAIDENRRLVAEKAEKRRKQIEENDKIAAEMRQKKSQADLVKQMLTAKRVDQMGPIERQMEQLEMQRQHERLSYETRMMKAEFDAEERQLRMQNPSYDTFKNGGLRYHTAYGTIKIEEKVKGKAYQNPFTGKWEIYQGDDE